MTPRRVAILAIVAVLLIGLGIWLTHRQSNTGGAAAAGLLYPSLKKELDSIETIRIFKAGDQRVVEIARTRTGPKVTERENYAADQEKLRQLLTAMADAKIYEEKTSNPASYPSLGVEDTSAATATGTRIELTGPATPVNLIVGKSGGTAAATYVRRAGEAQSWLVNASLEASTSPDEWLRKDLIDVAPDRVQSATVSIGGKSYSAAKSSRTDANFAVTGLAKGQELTAPGAANLFAAALSGLTLADVQPLKSIEATPALAHAKFTTFDGLIVDADGWVRDNKHYVAFKPAYDAALAERFKLPTTPPPAEKPNAGGVTPAADAKPAPTPTPAPGPDVAADTQTMTTQLTGWVYELPQYKYEAIFKPLEQLVKKPESAADLLKKKQ